MTVPQFYAPRQLTPRQLDEFLARGWYRMHQTIFTTNYIVDAEKHYRVFWLRYNLQYYAHRKNSLRILLRNRNFSFTVKPFALSNELERLYEQYRNTIAFEGAPSVKQWLFYDSPGPDIYDSHLIEIRDGKQLIAAGVFDKGARSVAGIMNFYDPAYRKYSLGKYLILLKMNYALEEGYKYYYPGYVVHGYPKFNYKLFVGEEFTEAYIPELKRWFPYTRQLLDVTVDA